MIGDYKVEWLKEIVDYPLPTKDPRIFYSDWTSAENSASQVKTYAAGIKNPSGKPFYGYTIYKPLGAEGEETWTLELGGFEKLVEACDYYEKNGKWPDE